MTDNITELNSSNLSPALRVLVSKTKFDQETFADYLRSPLISDDLNNFHLAMSDLGFAVPEDGDAFAETAYGDPDEPIEDDWYVEEMASKLREYGDFLNKTLADFRKLKVQARLRDASSPVTPREKLFTEVRAQLFHLLNHFGIETSVEAAPAVSEKAMAIMDEFDRRALGKEGERLIFCDPDMPVEFIEGA